MSKPRDPGSPRGIPDDALEAWFADKVAVSTASQQLSTLLTDTTVTADRGITLRNPASGSGIVYVRHITTNNDTHGFELNPGESIFLGIKDPNQIWVIGSAITNLEIIVT